MNNIKIRASKSLLDNWKIWLAIETIEQFKLGFIDREEAGSIIKNNGIRGETEIKFEINKNLSSLKLNDFQNEQKREFFVHLSETLLSQSKKIKNKIENHEDISGAKQEITNFYFNCIFLRLESANTKLYNSEMKSTQNIIIQKSKISSPVSFIKWISTLIKIVNSQKLEAERKKTEYLEQERAAYRAYINLSNRTYFSKNSPQKISEIWKAVEIIVESMLKQEICNSISQMYSKYINFCQIHKSYAEKSLAMLEEIKADLQEKLSIEIISLPLFTHLNSLDAKKQQKLLEIWIGGHSINYWSNAPLTYLQLENKLLDNLTETTNRIFQNFQACFIEMVSVEEISTSDLESK